MRRIGILAGMLVMALAGSGAAAGASSAAPPEFGRCAHTKAFGGEKFNKPNCNKAPKPDGTPRRNFEWLPGTEHAGFTASGPATTLESAVAGTFTLACKSQRESGEYSGTKSLKHVVMTFSDCSSGGTPCSNGEAGTIVSDPLEGAIGKKDAGAKRVLLLLSPAGHTGPFAQFTCGGTSVTLTGALLGPIPTNKSTRTYEIRYVAHSGSQDAEEFEGQSGDVLSVSLNGASAVPAGLTLHTTIRSEEAIEINDFI
jgi:hypothetical protein